MSTTYTVKSGDTKGKLKSLFGIDYNYSGYRSKDANTLFAGEVITIPDKSPALQVPSPIVGNTVDLSKITAGAKPIGGTIQQPQPIAPTPFVPMQAPTQTPAPTPAPTPKAPVNTGPKMSEADALRNDITQLEEKIANADNLKTQGYTDSNVYDDVKKLQEMKTNLATVQDELYKAQDRPAEIAVNANQALRGNQGTKASYDQMTTPQLENNALETLAKSREYARLGTAVSNFSEAISTNKALVNQRVDAQTANERFILEQKSKRLTAIEKQQADIITEAQKFLLQDRQAEIDRQKDNAKSEADLRKAIVLKSIDDGYTGSIESLMTTPIDQLMSTSLGQKGFADYSYLLSYSDEQAVALPKSLQEKRAIMVTADANKRDVIASTQDSIATLDYLLNNSVGLQKSVGTGYGYKSVFAPTAEVTTWRAKASQLVAGLPIKELQDAKKGGAVFGALSEKELQLLQSASSDLNPINNDAGRPTGQFNTTESAVRERLEVMRGITQKLQMSAYLTITEQREFRDIDLNTPEGRQVINARYNQFKDTQGSASQASLQPNSVLLQPDQKPNVQSFNAGAQVQAFSQVDPRWAKAPIAGSNVTIGTHGCLLSCIGTLFKTDPLTLATQNRDLFGTTGDLMTGQLLERYGSTQQIQVANGKTSPQGVAIARTSQYASKGYPTHFYLAFPDGTMIDPLSKNPVREPNKYLSTTNQFRYINNTTFNV